jgi:hypothetical protein
MKKLEITDVVQTIPHYINEWIWLFIWIWFKDLLNTRFDFDVKLDTYWLNLQRKYVWNDLQKSEFLLSIIKWNTKWITPFCLIETNEWDDKYFQVIDGKQRLMTIIDFLLWKTYIVFNNKQYYWNDLSSECQYAITWHWIKSNVAYQWDWWTDEDKLNWFKRVNFTWTPVEKNHLDKFIIIENDRKLKS